MTFDDRAMGMACWYANERQPPATVQLDVHFIDAVQIGEFVEAMCSVVLLHTFAGLYERRSCRRYTSSGDRRGRVEDALEQSVLI